MSIERFQVASKTGWEVVPARLQQGGATYTPVKHNRVAYLFGAHSPNTVEAFSLDTDTVTVEAWLQLPNSGVGRSPFSVTFVTGEELTYVAEDFAVKVDLRRRGGHTATVVRHSAFQLCATAGVTVNGRYAYFAQGRYVVRVDVQHPHRVEAVGRPV